MIQIENCFLIQIGRNLMVFFNANMQYSELNILLGRLLYWIYFPVKIGKI
jgi:hypothetical protein